jgi:hypothetical protein
MLDDSTRAHCHHIQQLCTGEGLDLFEAMEKAGLLVSADKRKAIEYHVLTELLGQLGDQQDTSLALGLGKEMTVTGAVRGVTRFIELFTQGRLNR